MSRELLNDIATVPNAISACRLAASPFIANRLERHPDAWLPAAVLLATDMLDGAAARAGNNSEVLQKLGFRSSNAGKVLDHGTDAIAPLLCANAGMKAGIIPKSVGAAVIAQKVAIAGYSTYRYALGNPVEVSTLGKRAEFMKVAGLGSLFIANSIDDQSLRNKARAVSLGMAVTGVAAALIANHRYIKQ